MNEHIILLKNMGNNNDTFESPPPRPPPSKPNSSKTIINYQQLWQRSPNSIKLSNFLCFTTNFTYLDQNMALLPKKLHQLFLTNLCKTQYQSISLQCLEISYEAIKNLTIFLASQQNYGLLRLTFDLAEKENLQRFSNRFPINSIFSDGKITTAKNIKFLVLENLAKSGTLEIDGKNLADLIKTKEIVKLTIKKIYIVNFKCFVDELKNNRTLTHFILQSEGEFNDVNLKLLYKSLKNKPNLKLLKIMNKYGKLQIDWNEYSNLLYKNTTRINEIILDLAEIAEQGATMRIFDSLTTLRKISLARSAQKAALALQIQLFETLENNTNLQILDLSHMEITAKGIIDSLCKIVENTKTLHTLFINHTLNAKSESRASCDELFEKIANNSSLRTLDLSSNLYRKDEEELIPKICGLSKSIERMNLANCSLSDKICSEIFTELSKNAVLSELNMSSQFFKGFSETFEKTGSEIAKYLEKGGSIKKLDISGNNFTSENSAKIMQSLSKNAVLQSLVTILNGVNSANELFLSLESNKSLIFLDISQGVSSEIIFTQNAIKTLGNSLKSNKTLKLLKIVGEFERDSIEFLSDGLSLNNTIQEFWLQNTKIRKKECVKFFEFISKNKVMQKLTLIQNAIEFSNSKITTICDFFKQNTTLNEVIISKDGISEISGKELKKLEKTHFWLRIEIF